MMPKDAPPCICKKMEPETWESRGGHYGGSLNQSTFRCPACGRYALCLYGAGGNAFIQRKEGTVTVESDPIFTEAESSYLDQVLLAAWRVSAAERERLQKGIHDREWDEICRTLDIPLKTKMPECPVDKQGGYHRMLDALYANPAYIWPEGWQPPVPPQLPATLVCSVRYESKGDWTPVDHAESAKLSIPPDPIRVDHDAHYREVFDEVGKALRVAIQPINVPNEYYERGTWLEPWFSFRLGDSTFVVGPRKRVTNVRVESDEPFDVRGIAALAKQDQVTYDQDDMRPTPERPTAKKVVIHAWGKGKLVEYLTLLGHVALGHSVVDPVVPSPVVGV